MNCTYLVSALGSPWTIYWACQTDTDSWVTKRSSTGRYFARIIAFSSIYTPQLRSKAAPGTRTFR